MQEGCIYLTANRYTDAWSFGKQNVSDKKESNKVSDIGELLYKHKRKKKVSIKGKRRYSYIPIGLAGVESFCD